MDSFEEKVYLFMDNQHSDYSSNDSDIKDIFYGSDSHESNHDPIEITLYWESQLALLQEILERCQLTGSKLRQEVARIMKKVTATDFCSCFKPSTNCVRRQVAALLSDRGFSTNLCISKWKTTKKFPGGSHEYIEVIASTSTRKKQVPFLIELEFKDQFQIAKAGEEYQRLVSCLPEFYIGKPEYLTAIVGVMCDAAKKSMKEKKMHLGPWRKSSFMQMKWSGFNQTETSNKTFGRLPTYHHTEARESNLGFSGAHNAVVVR